MIQLCLERLLLPDIRSCASTCQPLRRAALAAEAEITTVYRSHFDDDVLTAWASQPESYRVPRPLISSSQFVLPDEQPVPPPELPLGVEPEPEPSPSRSAAPPPPAPPPLPAAAAPPTRARGSVAVAAAAVARERRAEVEERAVEAFAALPQEMFDYLRTLSTPEKRSAFQAFQSKLAAMDPENEVRAVRVRWLPVW